MFSGYSGYRCFMGMTGCVLVDRAAGECIRRDMFLPLDISDLELEWKGFCFKVEQPGVGYGSELLVSKQ